MMSYNIGPNYQFFLNNYVYHSEHSFPIIASKYVKNTYKIFHVAQVASKHHVMCPQIGILFLEIFDVLINYYYYPWLVYELSKTIFFRRSKLSM